LFASFNKNEAVSAKKVALLFDCRIELNNFLEVLFNAFFTPVRSFDIYGEFPVFIVNARSVVINKSSLADRGVVFSSRFLIDGNITECTT
jgi:hypothetical protein